RRAAMARAVRARVARRAGVPVVARGRVGRHDAVAGRRVAGVVGADVAVIAVSRLAHARAAAADVPRRAGIAVVARGRIRCMDAAAAPVARVVGAGVVVLAVERRPAHTGARCADVGGGAGVGVLARVRIEADDLARTGAVAGAVVGADVGVIAGAAALLEEANRRAAVAAHGVAVVALLAGVEDAVAAEGAHRQPPTALAELGAG